ncbi:hypothetical protein NDU88_004876 [Pleurodeles waltl]|uniref:Uncharacterized protein n=1 Tax=Pleurodeles waltl TaxID=8319 RepID=A0AAV7L2M1_PLEWA|nr:hypothetical protein NDU88_004876 [Pleurodeles waltl]
MFRECDLALSELPIVAAEQIAVSYKKSPCVGGLECTDCPGLPRDRLAPNATVYEESFNLEPRGNSPWRRVSAVTGEKEVTTKQVQTQDAVSGRRERVSSEGAESQSAVAAADELLQAVVFRREVVIFNMDPRQAPETTVHSEDHPPNRHHKNLEPNSRFEYNERHVSKQLETRDERTTRTTGNLATFVHNFLDTGKSPKRRH